MVLSSLQDQSHVASLLGYSNFGEVTVLGPPLTPAMSVRAASSSSSVDAYDPLHLAEVLLRTLLLSIGFYTVWERGVLNCLVFVYLCIKSEWFSLSLHFLSVFLLCAQERAFGELEKNSDKQLSSDNQGQSDPPSHFHQLLSGLHKHLLAHCYIHSSTEVQHSSFLCKDITVLNAFLVKFHLLMIKFMFLLLCRTTAV